MPFFNFRRGGSNAAPNAGSAAQTESVEVIRKRAKHRLIGSAVLVLIGVVGFPLVFDTQPRPIPVDIPIEIPGKGTVKPLVVPAPAAATAPAATPKPGEKVAANASLSPKEEILSSNPAPAQASSAPVAIKNEAKPQPKPEPKPEVKPEPKPAAKPAAKPDDAARASALLNGAAPAAAKPPAAEAEGRFVVQVGAFAEDAKAREARLKVEKAGLKTYTQVAETKDGKRIRVRVGPFATKAEAEKAASKIKTLDLPAAILTL
jgi:DedD protein